MKNISSGYVENQAGYDFVKVGQQLGILKRSTDDTKSLDLKYAMAVPILFPTQIFFGYTLNLRKTKTTESLSLEQNDNELPTQLILSFEKIGVIDLFQNLKIDESYKNQISEDFQSFLKSALRDKIESFSNETLILTIKEMYERYPSTHLDWLQIINNLMSNDSKKLMNDTILIHNPKLFEDRHKKFQELDES